MPRSLYYWLPVLLLGIVVALQLRILASNAASDGNVVQGSVSAIAAPAGATCASSASAVTRPPVWRLVGTKITDGPNPAKQAWIIDQACASATIYQLGDPLSDGSRVVEIQPQRVFIEDAKGVRRYIVGARSSTEPSPAKARSSSSAGRSTAWSRNRGDGAPPAPMPAADLSKFGKVEDYVPPEETAPPAAR